MYKNNAYNNVAEAIVGPVPPLFREVFFLILPNRLSYRFNASGVRNILSEKL